MSGTYYQAEWRFGSSSRITQSVQRIILACSAVFAVQLLLDIPLGYLPAVSEGASPPGGRFLVELLSFQPVALLYGAVWKPFTYMFLHGNLLHLFLNMLWLFFFGPDVERALGTRQFLVFYIVCGALAVFGTFIPALLWGSGASVTGASGAVMAVMVAFAVVNPEREFFMFPLPVPINARALVLIVIGMNILTALQGGNVSVATHLGGMAVGYGYMKALPIWLNWRRMSWREDSAKSRRDPMDKVGEAIDNIFEFKGKNRKR